LGCRTCKPRRRTTDVPENLTLCCAVLGKAGTQGHRDNSCLVVSRQMLRQPNYRWQAAHFQHLSFHTPASTCRCQCLFSAVSNCLILAHLLHDAEALFEPWALSIISRSNRNDTHTSAAEAHPEDTRTSIHYVQLIQDLSDILIREFGGLTSLLPKIDNGLDFNQSHPLLTN
jgi:hypothetical protein